jgi:hypothetical protein
LFNQPFRTAGRPCAKTRASYARPANAATRIVELRIVAIRAKTRHPFALSLRHLSWIQNGADSSALSTMSLPFEVPTNPHDPRAVRILAKSIYRELRGSGLSERDVMGLAAELLALVTSDVKREPGSRGR